MESEPSGRKPLVMPYSEHLGLLEAIWKVGKDVIAHIDGIEKEKRDAAAANRKAWDDAAREVSEHIKNNRPPDFKWDDGPVHTDVDAHGVGVVVADPLHDKTKTGISPLQALALVETIRRQCANQLAINNPVKARELLLAIRDKIQSLVEDPSE